MKKILVLGAGLSTPTLISYLLKNSDVNGWQVTVGDISKEIAEQRINGHTNGKAIQFDVNDEEQRNSEIGHADIVISMLPARMHYLVAGTCLKFKKNMVTASYVSKEIKKLDTEARELGVLFLNEVGLDPGIDHMSAMQIIDSIKAEGGELVSFKSSTGGLVAPKFDNNPWNYKFTWNPRNVVLAGQGGAQLIKRGMYKYIPYHKLFTRLLTIDIDGYGEFEVYPNRDSLSYRTAYGIDNIPSMFRGTIRRPGFSKTWNTLVQLGVTDDSFVIENSENLTYREFTNSFLRYDKVRTVEDKFAEYVGIDSDSFSMYKIRWLGLFSNEKIGLKKATPAQILQKKLEEKWALEPEDKDMIVMQHGFEYKLNDKYYQITSSMVVEGKDNTDTAMAITVGLPVAIGCKLILEGKITGTGIKIPTSEDIYKPILEELANYKIVFKEEKKEIDEPNGK
ncbi:MAG: saccharopine dehydrogenase NADP-binding domain-containing protein [Bacteroidales bacterium]|nr:saccharopine dehydrogenase NADP-binding domain-containing protein [Bacteroidales bacterium]MCF8404195.1 saccharopine dehydrogenase NADP-binding domain-containing protein [Bacteroidales bacterium]